MNWNFWRFKDFLSFKLNSFQWRVIRSWYAKGREEANPVFWLATRAGKVSPSCPFGISRMVQQEKNSLFGHIINPLLPSLFGKSGWLLASLFFVFLLASTLPRFIQTQKRPWPISSHLDHKLGQQRIYLDKGMISIIQWSKSCWQLTIFFFALGIPWVDS